MSRPLFILGAVSAVLVGACSTPIRTVVDPGPPAVVVTMRPDRAWTDTGMSVHLGESLLFMATGQVWWEARRKSAGPDGIGGSSDFRIGAGGLIGRVDSMEKPFDIGARTGPYKLDSNPRSRRFGPAPPIQMRGDGMLLVGFKKFMPGANRGAFDVTIRRMRAAVVRGLG